MFVGHVGAALAIGRAERRVNVGVFVFATLLLDVVLWLLVLLGWESITISPTLPALISRSLYFLLTWFARQHRLVRAGRGRYLHLVSAAEGEKVACCHSCRHSSLLALASRCARPCPRVAARGRQFHESRARAVAKHACSTRSRSVDPCGWSLPFRAR